MKNLFQVRIIFADSGEVGSVSLFDNLEDLVDYFTQYLNDSDFVIELSRREVQIL